MPNQQSVFISYAHADKDRVVPIASYLGRLGLRVWMDTKELAAGQTIVEQVSEAIEKSDLYVVALSPSAIDSKWVNHELNTALTLELSQGRPKVLPVIVADVDVPATIKARLYVDLSGTLDAGKGSLKKAIQTQLPELELVDRAPKDAKPELILSSVTLQLRLKTDKYYGGPMLEESPHDKREVTAEARDLLKHLRRKANGLLLNFMSAAEMDFTSPYPKFPNGELTEAIEDASGEWVGTFAKEAVLDVEVLNPDEKKLDQLVSTTLESFGVSKAVYSFAISPAIPGLPQQVLERLQGRYVILGWDPENGADVELPDDLRISVASTEERIRLGIETKYSFQFGKRAKEFSVREFIDWLIKTK